MLHTRAMWPCQMSDKSWLFVGANLSASTSLEWWLLFSPMVKMPQLMTQRACFLKGKNLLKKSHCFGTSPLDSTCFFLESLTTVYNLLWRFFMFIHPSDICRSVALPSWRRMRPWPTRVSRCGHKCPKIQFLPSFSPQGSLNGTHIGGIKQYKSMVISRDFHGLPLE